MVLGISGINGSGSKEGGRINIISHSPRKISASFTERSPDPVIAPMPRSAAADSPRIPQLHVASPSMRDWNVFENPLSLRAEASAAAALAQAALVASAPSIAVQVARAGAGDADGKFAPKHSLSTLPQSSTAQSEAPSRHCNPQLSSAAPLSGEESVICSPAPSVADLVAVYESAVARDGRSSAGASPSAAQKKSLAARAAASKSDHRATLSPRSSAAAASVLQRELRSASESAVKSCSSAAALQLYPPNAAWNDNSSDIIREIHATSNAHDAQPAASPKSRPERKAVTKAPLKTTAAERARTPAVSNSLVMPPRFLFFALRCAQFFCWECCQCRSTLRAISASLNSSCRTAP
jgi:hypothetical protein